MICIVIHTVKKIKYYHIFCIYIANKLVRSELSLSKTILLRNTFCDCVKVSDVFKN